ncbi:MAG: rRNA pseudouridine synthase [Ignavibacteria bacterium]|nr:rRNA pseudouridine synthase [Ignavibacteria bacterium]
MQVRLNKFIASSGLASRRNADELIKEARVMVNENIVLEPGLVIETDKDVVYLDGEKISQVKRVYYLLHKPRGYVTSTADEQKRPVVVSLVPPIPKVFPVGRLDINTTGLLLLTNDGDFSNFILHPSNGFIREYIAELNVPLDEVRRKQLEKGIMVEKKFSRFLSVKFPTKNKKIVVVRAEEGRNHFVKNMFSTLGIMVVKLHREKLGPFAVEGIHPGRYIIVPESKIKKLLEEYGVRS